MAIDLETLGAANSYTRNSLNGVGAIAGKPCQIQSIDPIDGGKRVTFLWIDNEGNSHTSTMDVMNGDKGTAGTKGDKGDTGDVGPLVLLLQRHKLKLLRRHIVKQ